MNQTLPSGPTAIPTGAAASVGSSWTVMRPSMPIRPMALAWFMVNHIESPAAAMAEGNASVRGSGYSVTVPSVVTRPMRSAAVSVNHSAPSGPAAMPKGPHSAVGSANSVTW